MLFAVVALCVVVVGVLILAWRKNRNDRTAVDQHSITVADLRSLMSSGQEVPLFDVRQPLDLLAYPELIPGAKRVSPDDALGNPSPIPKDKEAIVYCTCAGEKTSRAIVRRALDIGFLRVKFLKGGLAAWKAEGYPVEPYQEVFHLHRSKVPAESR